MRESLALDRGARSTRSFDTANLLYLEISTCAADIKPSVAHLDDMSSSDLSPLSSALSSDNEAASELNIVGGIDRYFKSTSSAAKQTSPPAKKKRPPSPPHEYVLADSPDIAVSQEGF